jgi:hypothetical protein
MPATKKDIIVTVPASESRIGPYEFDTVVAVAVTAGLSVITKFLRSSTNLESAYVLFWAYVPAAGPKATALGSCPYAEVGLFLSIMEAPV